MGQKRAAIDIDQDYILEIRNGVRYSLFCVIYFGKYLARDPKWHLIVKTTTLLILFVRQFFGHYTNLPDP